MARSNKDRTIAILRRAVEILSKRGAWIQGMGAMDKSGNWVQPDDSRAAKFCAIGAVSRAVKDVMPRASYPYRYITNAQAALAHTLKGNEDYVSVVNFNDKIGRRKAQVINVFEKTIARLEAE